MPRAGRRLGNSGPSGKSAHGPAPRSADAFVVVSAACSRSGRWARRLLRRSEDGGLRPAPKQEQHMIRTIAAALAAFALVSFGVRAEDAKPAAAAAAEAPKAEEKADKAE